jgi:hypothetical protein
MPESTSRRVLYLVQRRHWQINDDDREEVEPGDPRPDVRPHPYHEGQLHLASYRRNPDDGGVPVRAFRDPARAEAFRRQQEEARRAATNPFRYGWGLETRSSLDEGRFHDWLLDAGLTPPGSEGEAEPPLIRTSWRAWWEQIRGRLTDEHRLALARALNNALAGVPYGGRDADGPSDLAWLDDCMSRIDDLTVQQRASLRMGLIFTPINSYPPVDGERDHYLVEAKWRRWWDRNHAAMSDYQRHQVWEALDKVWFFEVIEVREP